MKTALGVVGGLLLGAAIGWGVASTYPGRAPLTPTGAPAGVPATVAEADLPVLELDGVKLAPKELPTQLRSQLFEKQHEAYETTASLLQQFALQLSLAKAKDKDARAEKLPPFDELLGLPKPGDADLKAVFEANKSRLPPNTSFEQVKGEIERFVQNQKVAEALRAKTQELKTSGRLKLLLPEPEAPLVDLKLDQHPSKGAKDARLVLAEASDYLCPHCQQMHAEVAQSLKDFEGKLRFVQINFSLKPDQLSGSLIRAAYCARKQSDEHFWRFHDAAFKTAKEKAWKTTDRDDKAAVALIAREAGLDEGRLNACLDSAEAKDHVLRNNELMSAVGISGTPTFYLNNRRILHHMGSLRDYLAARVASSSH